MMVLGHPFDPLLAIALGLVFGSFASAVSYRLPRGMGIVGHRSVCPHCTATLGVIDLVPLLSWFASGGRCRHCGLAYGRRYPVIELTSATGFLAAWLVVGFGPAFPILAALSVILLVLSLIDIDHGYLPNPLQLAAGVLAPGWWMNQADPTAALLAGVVAGLVLVGIGLTVRWMFRRWRGREGLGLGDVKLLGVAGLWLGLAPLPVFLILGGLFGVVIALVWRTVGRGDESPLGPALALSLYLCLVLPGAGTAF